MSNMCLSVNKTIECCCESINGCLEARPINVKVKRDAIASDDVNEILNTNENEAFISDYLALGTQYTRKFFNFCIVSGKKVQQSTFYK